MGTALTHSGLQLASSALIPTTAAKMHIECVGHQQQVEEWMAVRTQWSKDREGEPCYETKSDGQNAWQMAGLFRASRSQFQWKDAIKVPVRNWLRDSS